MRDTNFDCQSFCRSLDSNLSGFATSKSSELLSRITPSAWETFENDIVLKTNKKDDLILLAILSWYYPEWLGMLIRLHLEEFINNKEDLFEINFLLQSKAEMLIFLQETSLWHTRDFYGNIISEKKLKKVNYLFSLRFKTKRRPKRVQRHRGYRDKGSLRPECDKHDLWLDTKGQLEIEDKRKALDDTYQLCRGFLFGG